MPPEYSNAALRVTARPLVTISSTTNSSTPTICLPEPPCSRTWSVWGSTKTSLHNSPQQQLLERCPGPDQRTGGFNFLYYSLRQTLSHTVTDLNPVTD